MFKHEESNRLIMHEKSILVDIKGNKAAIWSFEPKPALRVYQLTVQGYLSELRDGFDFR